MLKFFVLAVCAFVTAHGLSQELKEKFMERLEKVGGECAKEVGANEDDIAELISHKFPSRHEGQCMIFCFYKRFDMMHDDGTFHQEGALKMMEPLKADDPALYEKFLEVGKYCIENVAPNDDKCLYAANHAKCGVEKGKELGMDASILE